MGGPGSNGGYFFDIGEIKNFTFYKLEDFQKIIKKSMKILKIFENFKGDFAISWKVFKISSKHSQKFSEQVRKF